MRELKLGNIDQYGVVCALVVVVLAGGGWVERGETSPIQIPDLTRCENATDTSLATHVTYSFNCCLLLPSKPILNFSFEKYKAVKKHIRRPAHTASEAYIAKYNKAYELMMALPDSDPRSFIRQANMHCAFCNGAYKQAGIDKEVPLQVHFSWFFLPWHRWYLFFHERILASLIGDPGFSLVYWNWDDQSHGGNVIPEMFTRNGTAIFDPKRNQANLPPTIVRLGSTINSTDNSVVANENLNSMYQSIVTASTPDLFYGGAYRTGTDLRNSSVLSAPLGGAIEMGVHGGIHFWTGDPTQNLRQHMGTFTTASRDPIFYTHHSNVDRLWDVWRYDMPGGERQGHTDPDFLDAEFVFYDENADMVRVRVRDALDGKKLGVSYKKGRSDRTWVDYKPKAVTNGSAVPAARASGAPVILPAPANGTIQLGLGVVAIVETPKEKKPSKAVEVLTIQGVELTRDNVVALVVFVNLPTAGSQTKTSSAEYVGTLSIMPTESKHRHLITNAKFEIGDNLKRIGIQKEKEVVITILVKGNETVTIQGMQIAYE